MRIRVTLDIEVEPAQFGYDIGKYEAVEIVTSAVNRCNGLLVVSEGEVEEADA